MYRSAAVRKWVCRAALLAMACAVPAGASDLEERLERLEGQMERLIRQLEERAVEPERAPEPEPARDVAPPAPAAQPPAPAAAPPAAERPASAAEPAVRSGEVRLRYYMASDPLGTEPPRSEPMADGLFRPDGELRMDPFRYGAAERRLIGGSFRDPSVHRAVGLLIEGQLDIPQTGVHRFELTPKPARDRGEAAAYNSMTVFMWVDGEQVLGIENEQSWRRQFVERTLPEGRHPFRLWVVSNSPGHGASPIDSQLGLEVVMPGRAELTPLWRQMSPP
jgi:hypothetical protein